MSLLNSVLGAALGAKASGQGSQGGDLMALVTQLLANDGPVGGLPGLIAKFQQAGLGNLIQSWVGTGANLPVSAAQMEQVLGSPLLGQLAGQMGMAPQQAGGQLAQWLPLLIDQLTPKGQVPAGGVQAGPDLLGLVGSLLKAR